MFVVEPMKKKHIEEVYQIELESFTSPWSKKSLKAEVVANEHAHYFVVMDTVKNKVAGYGGMWHIVNEGHITNIAVKGDYRRHGVATLLVEHINAFAKTKEMIGITLEVRVTNIAAQALYKKLGFDLEGIRKEYYSDTKEDALIMWKYLIPKDQIIM